jgi:hypothetical protein
MQIKRIESGCSIKMDNIGLELPWTALEEIYTIYESYIVEKLVGRMVAEDGFEKKFNLSGDDRDMFIETFVQNVIENKARERDELPDIFAGAFEEFLLKQEQKILLNKIKD